MAGKVFLRDDGFTLLETVLALSIISVLLLLLFSSLRLGIDAWDRGQQASGRLSARVFIASMLFRDIGSAFPYVQRYGEEKELMFKGAGKALSFEAACASQDASCAGSRLVSYDVKEEGLVVSQSAIPAPLTPQKHSEVFSEVREGSFEYMGAEGWSEAWEASGRKSLPYAIRVKLVMNEDARPLEVTIPINVAAKGAR